MRASLNTSSLLILVTIVLHGSNGSERPDCSFSMSRVARDLLRQNFYPVLKAEGWELPLSCPLRPSRDMYLYQEERKWYDKSRWNCNICGKAFSSENFLDAHFTNRHQDTFLSGSEAVCLADHCDYLRCDVISGAKKGSYWDKTMCRQPDLDKLMQRCEAVVKSCLPAALTGMRKHELRDKLKKVMCSSLTCDQFWEVPSQEFSPHGKIAYTIVTCLIIVGLLLYYLVAYTHFYTDNSLLNTTDEGLFNAKGDEPYFTRNPHGNEIRSRNQHVSRR